MCWFRRLSFIILCAGILLTGCAGRRSVILDKPVPVTKASNAAALREEGDKLWKLRDDPQKARQALAAYRRAFAADPGNVELGTRLARAFYLVGYYVETDPVVQDSLFLRGVETGERVLALNDNFRTMYRKTQNDARALAVLDRNWVNPIYWTAMNLERWISSKSTWVRYGNKQRVEAYMARVRELDPNFFYGAVPRFFGVLPTQGRAPFVHLEDSKREFDSALAMAPNFFANHRTYAETYAVKTKDRELFKKLLEQVINGNPNALPDVAPENKYEQEKAKRMLARIDEYFEKKR
ncbi:MAG: TRAP transporter TatT component family protein [candidate division KSB1 bacterium]|nr:TRAP transporter TatT component family protein [candidate division KSB1 bacterium]MDZ7302736.1 TRAP transporter TatT component family protein [candidate division KSB1 bacterium]MDZ7310095.1 TRAP transporter TatT component family protein [candidate division KSB1 bacterium]